MSLRPYRVEVTGHRARTFYHLQSALGYALYHTLAGKVGTHIIVEDREYNHRISLDRIVAARVVVQSHSRD